MSGKGRGDGVIAGLAGLFKALSAVLLLPVALVTALLKLLPTGEELREGFSVVVGIPLLLVLGLLGFALELLWLLLPLLLLALLLQRC